MGTVPQKRERVLDDAELGKPIRGIVPVLVVVGFSGERVEGITPSPDYRGQWGWTLSRTTGKDSRS